MNDELKERLTGYLDAIEQAAEQGAGFVGEQAPLVAQEYLAWYFWSSVLAAALCLAVIVAVSIVGVTAFRIAPSLWKNESCTRHLDINMTRFLAVFLSAIVCIAPTIILCVSVGDAVKVSVAPRVVLLEKVQEMVK